MSENPVTQVPAAAPPDALAHFERLLSLETDCWDVHAALAAGLRDLVVLDVRSPEDFGRGHVPGAVSLPRRRISEAELDVYPAEVLFVVYCAGPHCNGADRAAALIARLGRRVKKMLGGVTGWADEGFELEPASDGRALIDE